jgi:hypothetical protein
MLPPGSKIFLPIMLIKLLDHPTIHWVETARLNWTDAAFRLRTRSCFHGNQPRQAAYFATSGRGHRAGSWYLPILVRPFILSSIPQHMFLNLLGWAPTRNLLIVPPLPQAPTRFDCTLCPTLWSPMICLDYGCCSLKRRKRLSSPVLCTDAGQQNLLS